jgi:hypothetical protein
MDYELRIIVEKVAVSSQEVVKRDTIKIYDIQRHCSKDSVSCVSPACLV